MKIIVSGLLLACLVNCGREPVAEQKSVTAANRMAETLATSLTKLIDRIAATVEVAPNVRNAVTDALVKDNNGDLIRIIDMKTRVPEALKAGTVHLDDYYLTDAGAAIVNAQGSVAYLQAKSLLDTLLEELTTTLPREIDVNDINPAVNKVVNAKKDLHWTFKSSID